MSTRFPCSGEAAAHAAAEGDYLECIDCKRFVPVSLMQVHNEVRGLLCEACSDEQKRAPKLRVGDTVNTPSGPLVVTDITLCSGIWPDEGESVQRVNWLDLRDRSVAVELQGGKWAWGYQLAPHVPEPEASRRQSNTTKFSP